MKSDRQVPWAKDWISLTEVVLVILPFDPPLKQKIRDKMKAQEILAVRTSELLGGSCNYRPVGPSLREVQD